MAYMFGDDRSKKDIQRISGEWTIPPASTDDDPILNIPVSRDIYENYCIIGVIWRNKNQTTQARDKWFSTPITKGAGQIGLTGWGGKASYDAAPKEFRLQLYGYNDKPTGHTISYSIFLLKWR